MSKNTNIADLINYISVDGSGNVVLTTGGQVATQSYVTTAVSNLVNSAPSTLDTLNELATALGNDANFATTVTTSIATKLPLAGGTLTGALTGTSATFSGNLEVFSGSAGVTVGDFLVNPTTKYVYVGRQSSTSGDNTTFVVRDRTGSARATIPGGGSIDTVFSTNNSNFIVSNYSGTSLMTIANTGAATFSSSVTAGGLITKTAGSAAALLMNDTSGNNKWEMGWEATSNNFYIYSYGGGISPFRITSGGNVGIGTSSPLSLLQVGGIGNSSVRLGVSSTTNTSATYSFVAWNSSGNDILGARGDGLVYAPFIYSTFTTGAAANMGIDSAGGFYRSVSSIKYKKNVENYTKGLAEVMQIRPVFYNSINEKEDGITYAGLIAEEVHELGLTEFVQYAEDGSPDALAYQNMIALAFKAIQELKAENDELRAILNRNNII